jgi:outer membrane protein assembly factor BamB
MSMKINPRLQGQIPAVEAPTAFASPDGTRRGWKVALPGRRPLATPAVAAGRVFLGGGFGSYDFYALDADTGHVAWQYQTTDDGPTAAVVEEDLVAFNTESCELEILTVEGRSLWKKWLGDPLMSMPALGGGRVFQAYPDSRGDHRHYLAAFDLRSGADLWRQPIGGEIITAPVLAEGHVFATTLDGNLHCFHQADGTPLWHEPKDATSSPAVWRGRCYFSQRKEIHLGEAGRQAAVQQTELLCARESSPGAATHEYAKTRRPADYLDHGKRKARSPHYQASTNFDAEVGFAHSKGDAKMEQAMRNLGHAHVSSIWAYQGSKPFLSRGRMYSALGDTLHCVDAESEASFWQRRLHEPRPGEELLDGVLTPPALVNGKVFVGSIFGVLYCLSAATGETLWSVPLDEPIVFQPAVARGRVYVGTHAGSLFSVETGDATDDGWLMWGANPAHNGIPE